MTTIQTALVFLFLIQVKHVIIDFVLQTMEQVRGKGIYGNMNGIRHSVDHAVMTFVIVIFPFGLSSAFLMGFIDFITHYHIDWVKMNYGNRDMMNEKFWHHLGYDQFAHQCVYLFMVLILFWS